MNTDIKKIIDEAVRDICSVENRSKSRVREIVAKALASYHLSVFK